ncbi:MAG: ribonuclease catalytic domain-containing protein [Candidatus Binatia bacterium]
MQPGTVIAYREHGTLVLGVVQKLLSSDPSRVEVVNEEGKKQLLPRERVLFDCKQALSPTIAPAELKKQLQILHEQISAFARTVNLQELWDLLQDEPVETWTWEELATLALPAQADPLTVVGFLDALYCQSLYFKEKKPGTFIVRDAKSIEETLHQQQREQERAQTQDNFLAWTRSQIADPTPTDPPSGADRYLDIIKGLALYGEMYEKRPQAAKLLDEIGFRGKGHSWDIAFQLLVALKIWTVDEDLSLLRYKIPTRFPSEVLAAAEHAPEFVPGTEHYSDLTSLFTCTIDDTETSDIDDALSVSTENGRVIIGIHITDVGFFVERESELEKAALARGTSIYLPRGTFPMFPPTISEVRASLLAGSLRPTLSFFVCLDNEGAIQEERLCRGYIRVGRRLSYAEADEMIESGHTDPCADALRVLLDKTQRRRALRVTQGAVIIEGREIKVKVNNGDVSVTALTTNSPSRSLVGECMILANEMAAWYCRTQQLPALYISQPPPDEPVPAMTSFPSQRVYVHAARRAMKPSQMGTIPGAHTALGINLYTQVTSPLRRYHDLQMQRQIKHHLTFGAPLFSEEQLQVIAAGAQESSGDARRCERESVRYWLLRYLEKQKGQTVSGHVIREQNGRSFIELDDTLLIVPVNASPPLPLGADVNVVIGHVDARRDILTVRLADHLPHHRSPIDVE